MEFWQENKLFVIVAGLAFVAMLFLWPSIFGLGPSIVSLDRGSYGSTMVEFRSNEEKLGRYFPTGDKVQPVERALREAVSGNSVLVSNLDDLRAWMAFVPRFPFRIPGPRQGNERQRYVSLVYTYCRSGEILCDEFALRDYFDGVVFLAANRNVPLRDPFFGLRNMQLPAAINDPETCILQIALAHELGHLAIRLNVDEIHYITPGAPYTWRIGDAEMAQVYPVEVHFVSDLPTLLAFLHALDGAHGTVDDAAGGPGAPNPAGAAPAPAAPADPLADAIKPLPAEKPAAPRNDDDPEDPGPAPEPAPGAPAAGPPAVAGAAETEVQKLVLRLDGAPSFLVPDPSQANLKERFTILRPNEKDSQALDFIANAVVTRVIDPGSARITSSDIANWRTFCTRLNAQGSANAGSPGRRLWGLFPAGARDAAAAIAKGEEPDETRKAAVADALNQVLLRRDFYRADDFAGTPLSNEAQGCLKLDLQTLPTARLQRLNRLLIEAAYPAELARSTIKVEAEVERFSNLNFDAPDKPPRVVRKGDIASTRFFFLRNMKVKAVEGRMRKDKTGFPTDDVHPPSLDVDLSIAALSLLKTQAAKPSEKAPAGRGPVRIIHGRL